MSPDVTRYADDAVYDLRHTPPDVFDVSLIDDACRYYYDA